MTRSDCKKADLWAAALEAGELSEPSRLRLKEHLDHCQACRQRTQGLSAMAEMLREEPVTLHRHQANALWRNIEAAAAAAPSASVQSRPRRRHHFVILAAACAAMIALGGVLLLAGNETVPRTIPPTARKMDAPPSSAMNPKKGPAPAQVQQMPAPQQPTPAQASDVRSPRRWEISWINGKASASGRALGSGTTLTAGDNLQVAKEGRALLVGPSEVLVVGEGTSLGLEGSGAGNDRVRLERGQVTVLTRHGTKHDSGPRQPVEVAVAGLIVHPLGTVFSVSWSGTGAPQISLAEGRVVVQSANRSVTLDAPASLTWGEEPLRLSGDRARRLVARLTGAQQRTRPEVVVNQPRPARDKAPASTSRKDSLRGEIRALEQLLRDGKAAQVRARVEELLKDEGASQRAFAPALFNLVAESYMHQGNYPRARDAYLRTWQASRRSLHGMDALYNAGSIALDQLGQPAFARGHLKRYLADYPRGRQRQGAYYLLHRSLKQLGHAQAAAKLVTEYSKEYPRGQYLELLR